MSRDDKKPRRGFINIKDISKNTTAQAADREQDAPMSPTKASSGLTPRQPLSSLGGQLSQRLYITLPLSKKKIDCSHMLLDPAECIPGAYNMRNQSLLTRDNLGFMALVDAIEAEGQRDPVLARPVMVDGKKCYEIIYGTRRRAAVEYLSLTGAPDVKLRAWVGLDITDQDAQALAMSENADRQDVSVWEKALFAQQKQAEKESIPKIAEVLRVSEKTVYAYLKLANIPQTIVAMFASPELLSVQGGQQLAAQIKALSPTETDIQALSKRFGEQKAKTALEVVKAIGSLCHKAEPTNAMSAITWRSEVSSFAFSVRQNRADDNAFTVKLSGVDAERIELIKRAFRDIDANIHKTKRP